MRKSGLILFCIICLALLTGGLFLLLGCSGQVIEATMNYYGGSDPKGDFITVIIDQPKSKVKHINHTNGETEASQPWNDYTALEATDEYARGFGIIKKVAFDTGEFVLFAEFPNAACVYQQFNNLGEPDGDPVYVVYRKQVNKSSYYAKAYNWMKFFIDTSTDQTDMSIGFCAFDESSKQGLMYGADYSMKIEAEGDPDGGMSNINQSGNTVDDFTYDSATVSNIKWDPLNPDDLNYAISIVGTASDSMIIDFGSNVGGGMGLAIPQVDINWSQLVGTYYTMVYEYDRANNIRKVQPMKIVLEAGMVVKVFNFDKKTNTSDYKFSGTFESVESANGGPFYPTTKIADSLIEYSDCDLAVSSVVNNAYKCKGAFIVWSDGIVVGSVCDETGRFLGFTMFEDVSGGTNYIVRFGLGIRDTGYTNNYE